MNLSKRLTITTRAEGVLFTTILLLLACNFVVMGLPQHLNIKLNFIDVLLLGTEVKRIHALQNGLPFLWALVPALAAAMGILQSILIINNNRGYGFLLSVAGIIAMLMLQISFNHLYPEFMIQFTWAYWAVLLIFTCTSAISYLNRQNPINKHNQKKGFNINIITTLLKEEKPGSSLSDEDEKHLPETKGRNRKR